MTAAKVANEKNSGAAASSAMMSKRSLLSKKGVSASTTSGSGSCALPPPPSDIAMLRAQEQKQQEAQPHPSQKSQGARSSLTRRERGLSATTKPSTLSTEAATRPGRRPFGRRDNTQLHGSDSAGRRATTTGSLSAGKPGVHTAGQRRTTRANTTTASNVPTANGLAGSMRPRILPIHRHVAVASRQGGASEPDDACVVVKQSTNAYLQAAEVLRPTASAVFETADGGSTQTDTSTVTADGNACCTMDCEKSTSAAVDQSPPRGASVAATLAYAETPDVRRLHTPAVAVRPRETVIVPSSPARDVLVSKALF